MDKKQGLRCPCPNTKCELHGKCRECRARHKGKPYCRLDGFRQKINRTICKIFIRE